MKRLTRQALITLGFTAALAVTAARGQPYPNGTWTLDENGNGTFQANNLTGYSTGHLQTEPVSGVTTLYYPLFGPGVPNAAGDVLLLEGGGTNAFHSDLLRFDGQGGMYFFSDAEPSEPLDLADVPGISFPNARPDAVRIHEVGPEGNNGVLYVPSLGEPGFDTSGLVPGLQYNIISDSPVPEPSTAGLALAGLGVAARMVFRRRK